MCLAAIHWARIDRVYYAATRADAAAAGFDDEQLYGELIRKDAPLVRALVHVPMAGAEAPFAAWQQLSGRTPY